MLPRSGRLRTRDEIQEVFKRGKKYSTKPFLIWVFVKKEGLFRATIICSRKVDKRAIKRNLIKRRVREVLRRDIRPTIPTGDVVVQAQQAARDLTSKEIRNIFFNVLNFS